MGSFSAANVSKLDYNFEQIPRADGSGFCSGKGIIPEPSIAAIKEIATKLEAIGKAIESEPDKSDPEGTEESAGEAGVESAPDVDLELMFMEMAEALGDLCQHTPSADEISALPFRFQLAFAKWLMGELAPKD